MTTSKSTLRNLAGTAAVALAFNAANVNAAGLIDSVDAQLRYAPAFSQAIAAAAPNAEAPRIRAGGFMAQLEGALKSPADKTRILVYPKENSTNMLVLAAAVPAKDLPTADIPVCAQQNGKVLGAWNITHKGEVIPRTVTDNPVGSTRAACNATIMQAKVELDQKLAAAQPQAPAVKTSSPQP